MIYQNILPITLFLLFFLLVTHISQNAFVGVAYTFLTYMLARIFFGVKQEEEESEEEQVEETETDEQERIKEGERYYIYYDEDGLIRPLPVQKKEKD